MGTMLQKAAPSEGWGVPVNDILNIYRPDEVEKVHRAYIDAGADIIETNTFNANSVSLAPYGMQKWGYQMNLTGARIARSAADLAEEVKDDGRGGIIRERSRRTKKIYVAGSMGPTSVSLSLSGKEGEKGCPFRELASAYALQAEGLIKGGADFLLVETVFDGLNLKAALYGIGKAGDKLAGEGVIKEEIPVMVSVTVNDASCRTMTGQSAESLFRIAATSCRLAAFGLNCSLGAATMAECAGALRDIPRPLVIYPNAGMPDVNGSYDESPGLFAECFRKMAGEGLLNIAGGCCGTTPEHIAALKMALDGLTPRTVPASEGTTSEFINIGERANVNGSRKFARCIEARDFPAAAATVRKEIADGAAVVDLNVDDPMAGGAETMRTLVRTLVGDPAIAGTPLMIDSSDWETLVAGLEEAPGKSIANSISLRDGEDDFLKKAVEIRRLGASAVVMAFDEKGQAVTFDRKIEICSRAYGLLTEKGGYAPEDIIFDVNILPAGTGVEGQEAVAADFIKAVARIKEILPGCRTSGGVSNLSFAFRGNNAVREAMHSVFLYHAVKAGLDMAIVNPDALLPYEGLEPQLRQACEDVILNSDDKAGERLTAVASSITAAKTCPQADATEAQTTDRSSVPSGRRLGDDLLGGDGEFLEKDITDALAEYGSALKVVEGPLMEGMGRVGKLFSEGKVFLPQVIKSARIMKDATALLRPYMEKEEKADATARRKPVMVLATVKGDVHDIGKNICDIVLQCNDIEVIDLGIMVDNATIVRTASESGADFVGVSGLISPSLKYMEDLCRSMQSAGMTVPIFTGGAAVNSLFNAVRLAPLYGGAVVYTADASSFAAEAASFAADGKAAGERWRKKNSEIREMYLASHSAEGGAGQFVTVEEARRRAKRYPAESYGQPEGYGDSNLRALDIGLENIIPHIDWRMLLAFWGFKGRYPDIIYKDAEAGKCFEYAQRTAAEMLEENSVRVDVLCRFFDASSENEEIILHTKSGNERFSFPRCTSAKSDYECLADFVPPESSGKCSAVGIFVVRTEDLEKPGNPDDAASYRHLMRSALCARLTEAAAEWLSSAVAPEGTEVLRPAFGYPCSPDHTMKKNALALADPEGKLDIKFTESCAMIPETSLCGMLIAFPEAHYFKDRKSVV